MNDPTWNETQKNDSRVNQAERAVSGSLDKLEHAMESLTQKVEGGSQKIQHIVDMGSRQKQELLRLRETARNTVLPIFHQGKDLGRRAYSGVMADPRPYIYGALLFVGAVWLAKYSKSRRKTYSNTSYDESNPERWAA